MKRGSTARPVLKWAGGKTQLLDRLLSQVPESIECYFEPFVGGGALFFALAAQGRFRRAVLADRNPELVDVYRAVQRDVEAVIRALGRYGHSEQEYYEVRASQPRSLAQRAARTIYLNKTGYNGLYRVNRSGAFNVPFGRYAKPAICDAVNLRAVALALANVEVDVADFETTCSRARPGDFVYFDPPYVPLSKTASFTAYDRHPFAMAEHERLARVFGELAVRGVPAILSNSDTRETRRLFAGWRTEKVAVTRAINSRADGRGPISELLVCNQPPRRRRPTRARAQ